MAKSDPRLLKFIIEARKEGFSDSEIKTPLLEKGWQEDIIDKAFSHIIEKTEKRKTLTINLPISVINIVEKRANKNILSLEEQIEDIVRRSAVNAKNKKFPSPEKIDDLLVSIFSRRKRKTIDNSDD